MCIDVYKEIVELIMIRGMARDKKQFDIADRLRDFIEKSYKLKVADTKNGFCWTWNNI